jgi:hypothetical protein
MNYIEMAQEAGYSDYSNEVLVEVGMAIERAYCDWGHYEAGSKVGRHYQDVVDCFEYSDEEPSLESLVAAYAEGVVA